LNQKSLRRYGGGIFWLVQKGLCFFGKRLAVFQNLKSSEKSVVASEKIQGPGIGLAPV
jgi:hypothetical protein